MKIVILAAGFGTRLYPLTLNKPKCLLKVGDRTILDRIFDKLKDVKGCDKVYIVSNSRFYANFRDWLEKRRFNKPVEVIDDGSVSDEKRLGALGDIELAIESKEIDDDLLIIFGDNLFEFDLGSFLNFVKEKKDGEAFIALYDVKDFSLAKRYGIAVIDKDARIKEFHEKPEKPNGTLASTGIYYLPRRALDLFKEYIDAGLPKDPPGNFIAWLTANHRAYGFRFEEDWFDIGDTESLAKADEKYRRLGR